MGLTLQRCSLAREPIVDIGQLIVTSPDIRHNRPRISGTGVTVQRIIPWQVPPALPPSGNQ